MIRVAFVARLMTATALVTFGSAQGALAQGSGPASEREGDQSDVVVITALRKAESLMDAPVTVTAIGGEELLDRGVTDIQDIIALVPNAVIQENPESFNTFINIRGMRVVDVQAEPSVGLYRNGIYIGGHRANLGSQVDIERVEVLRGPQGGIYGRSSIGGTVDIIYATPSREFGGYAKAGYGSYNRTEVQGAVNLPVFDNAALRLTGWSSNQSESELFNTTLNEYVGAFSDRGVRVGYAVDFSEQLNVLWTLEHREWDGPSMRTYAPFGISNFGAVSRPETVDRIQRDTRSDAKVNETYLAQALSYDTGAGELKVNASYKFYAFGSIQDSDQTAIGPENAAVARQTDIIRDEGTKDYFVEGLWISPQNNPLTWMVGASYFKEKFEFARMITSRRNTPSFGIQKALIGFPKAGTEVDTETLSAFGTVDYAFNDVFTISGSLRYSEDTKSLTYLQGVLPTTTGDAALDAFFATLLRGPYPTYVFNSESKFDNWSPSVIAKLKLNDDMNIYATYGTGFRPGAFNLSPTTPATIPYGQETAQNYEAGFKGSFLDGRLDLSAAAFWMRQDDLLLAQTTSLAGADRTYLANVGTADTYGVELEARFQATDWLSGALSIGWLDPKFDNAVANPGLPTELDISGKLIPYTREFTANLFLAVDQPINDSASFVGSAAARYETGGLLGDYFVNNPYDDLTKIDLSAGVEFNGDTRVTATVRNLLDENVSQFWFYNRGTNTSEGQTWSVDLIHRF